MDFIELKKTKSEVKSTTVIVNIVLDTAEVKISELKYIIIGSI